MIKCCRKGRHISDLTIPLKEFDLTQSEAKIYLAGLEIGPATILQLARKSEVKRTTIYSRIEELIRRGFFSITYKGAKKLYLAEDPERLIRTVHEKERILGDALPELKSIYNLSPTKPKVMFYEGIEGIKKVMEDPLKVLKKGELYYRINPGQKEMAELVGWDWWKDLVKRRVEKGLPIKVIADRIQEPTPELISAGPEALRQIRFLPKNIHIPAREQIYGDRLGIIMLEKPMALVIEDKNIARLHQIFFEALWDKCEK